MKIFLKSVNIWRSHRRESWLCPAFCAPPHGHCSMASGIDIYSQLFVSTIRINSPCNSPCVASPVGTPPSGEAQGLAD